MTRIPKDELMQMARQAGFIVRDGYIYGPSGDSYAECSEEISALFNAIMDRAAVHFDDIGRYIDGSWSEGWCEPQEPGEIIRTLKISTGD